MKFEIISSKAFENIPSASGIVKTGDKYYVVGDDSPFLFCLDEDLNLQSKTLIGSAENMEGERIIKNNKPDFEAMEKINDQEFVIFGSGSKSPQRDYFVRITGEDHQEVESHLITSFYKHLKQLEIFNDSELNIEAAAAFEDELFLFNRNKNLLIRFNYSEFLNSIEKAGPPPQVSVTEVVLPIIGKVKAGFSGATSWPGRSILIFTASVEDTLNAYDDGEVLGSFLGLMDIRTGKIIGDVIPILSPTIDASALKVESVAIDKEISNKQLQLILTTDSDGGASLIIKGILALDS